MYKRKLRQTVMKKIIILLLMPLVLLKMGAQTNKAEALNNYLNTMEKLGLRIDKHSEVIEIRIIQ